MIALILGGLAGFLTTVAILVPVVIVFNVDPTVALLLGGGGSVILCNLGMYIGIVLDERRTR